MTVDLPEQVEIATPLPGSGAATGSEELIIKEARRRHRRRLWTRVGIATVVVAGVLTGLITLAGHGSSGHLSSPLPQRPRQRHLISGSTCQNGQLKVSALSGGAGMGQTDEWVGFLNASKTSCTLKGYPAVVALDARGNPVATARPMPGGIGGVTTGPTTPPAVTLQPGQSASTTIDGSSEPVGATTSCTSYPAFLITPPGLTRSTRVAAWSGWEPGPFPGCIAISVNPVVTGDRGPLSVGDTPVQAPTGSSGGTTPATTAIGRPSAPATVP